MGSTIRAAAVAALLVGAAARAEILQGIAPLDSLGDIRHKYPNAVILPVKAAWVKDSEAFYSLTGQGFPGVLYIAFEDDRSAYRQRLADLAADGAAEAASSPEQEQLQVMAKQPDNDALTVKWVRWVPEQPIPLARYKAKYGPPSKCDFSEQDMQPFCSWDSRGLLLQLTDDQSKVISAEASFTKAELRHAWQERYHVVPKWLEEDAPKEGHPPKGGGVKKTI